MKRRERSKTVVCPPIFRETDGKPIGPMDTLIAGTALASRCVLVTHNTGEFSRVKGLNLADWY